MSEKPIVMISSYTPRLCGIATFCEEAREFIQKACGTRPVQVISHTDGAGDGVHPIIDMSKRLWWKPVAKLIDKIKPYAVHIQHEYGLYNYLDERGACDENQGFLHMLDAISDWPVVVEPHTVHGRLTDREAEFVYDLATRTDILLLKCHYQKWRLDWNFTQRGWTTPRNIMVVPHGARPDRRWGMEDVPALRAELGLDKFENLGEHLVGLIGWIQSNKRWDILTSMWEDIAAEIQERTGKDWDLLAAGAMRDPDHRRDYEQWKGQVEVLQGKGLAHYYEFIPRGDVYYKMMAVCDFVVLPSVDETQSGTLARIIALNKPYITTAPMEGLTSQTLESEGGLMFTTKQGLRDKVIRLACDEKLRLTLGENLREYLDNVVSWDVVANQYLYSYELAREAKKTGKRAELETEF